MKKNALLLALFIALGGAAFYFSNCQKNTTQPERVLRHVVLFKFKNGTTDAETRAIEAAFMSLKTQLPDIVLDLEFGQNNSPEGLNQGLTHCFLVTFRSEKERAEYLPHPAHQAFVDNFAKKYVESVTVVDYWSR